RRIAVIGTGLIGGSFALALRKQFPDVSVVGYDRPDIAKRAAGLGAIGESATDIQNALRGADLIYLALPIIPALEALPEIAKCAEDGALVTDACSTKAAICRSARENFRAGAKFLGGHPMAGKERSGIEHADAGLFRGAPYALMGSQDSADAPAKTFTELVAAIGAQPVWCDAETHDWAVGIVSHLPQLVSIALARIVQDETDESGLPLSLAGQGLQDMLRLAGSPYVVWRDILLTNTENVSRALDRVAQAIDYLRTRLASKELEQEFHAANEVYKLLQKPR
ncbi:MAG: prephenate dehydrogenase/arogenate dehydrogenase family protein, partial [Acidobacteriota bacterium]|nr:prephenate dehydrogenase/arogenate dehydrogenase family protein [Acidobacteriota bacterium]